MSFNVSLAGDPHNVRGIAQVASREPFGIRYGRRKGDPLTGPAILLSGIVQKRGKSLEKPAQLITPRLPIQQMDFVDDQRAEIHQYLPPEGQ